MRKMIALMIAACLVSMPARALYRLPLMVPDRDHVLDKAYFVEMYYDICNGDVTEITKVLADYIVDTSSAKEEKVAEDRIYALIKEIGEEAFCKSAKRLLSKKFVAG